MSNSGSGADLTRRQREARTTVSEDKQLDNIVDEYEVKLAKRRQALEEAKRLRAERNKADMDLLSGRPSSLALSVSSRPSVAALHPGVAEESTPAPAPVDVPAAIPEAVEPDRRASLLPPSTAMRDSLQRRLQEALLAIEKLSTNKVADNYTIDMLKDGYALQEKLLVANRIGLRKAGAAARAQAATRAELESQLAELKETNGGLQQQMAEAQKQAEAAAAAAAADGPDSQEAYWESAAKDLREEKQRVMEERDALKIQVLRLRAELQVLQDRLTREQSRRR
eukprot:m.247898 g.247898  ORF g.247898 m.247898 type:complete len:282 (-) comp15556_c0_seq1:149-994(-)